MWIARDADESLWLFNEKPKRNEEANYWTISSPNDEAVGTLYSTMFPYLKWEDEPIEVDFTPNGKADRTYGYWTALRNSTAVAVMATLLEKRNNLSSKQIMEDIADLSVSCADVLIKKLKNTDIEL